MDNHSIIGDVAKIKEHIKVIEAENKKLWELVNAQQKRIEDLERKTSSKDFRKKQSVKRVLGFTLSKVRDYYNAVKSVDGEQIRIYIGKDTSEAEQKIIEHFVNNFRFRKSSIKAIRGSLPTPS